MNYKTQYGGKLGTPEINSGELLVETAGYISAKERIENIMLAGQRLDNYRKGRFDFEDEKSIDMSFVDPTREKGFDLADATQAELGVTARLEDQKRVTDEALKASQTALEAPQGSSEPQNESTDVKPK